MEGKINLTFPVSLPHTHTCGLDQAEARSSKSQAGLPPEWQNTQLLMPLHDTPCGADLQIPKIVSGTRT